MITRRFDRKFLFSLTLSILFTSPAWAVFPPTLPDGFEAKTVWKAKQDGCFFGINDPRNYYIKEGIDADECRNDGGKPKANNAYVWAQTEANDRIWFSVTANVPCLGSIIFAPEGIIQGDRYVCEGILSTYTPPPGTAPLLQLIGDWRPPQIWVYNPNTGNSTEITPDDPNINQVAGLRAAGHANGVVYFGGVSGKGIILFAYDANNLRYIGSTLWPFYTDIRKFVTAGNGKQLYAGVMDWTGAGAVIRFRGNKGFPWWIQTVGKIDNYGANIAVHDDRLFVSTWPLSSQSNPIVFFLNTFLPFMNNSSPPASVWMSPPLGSRGLSRTHQNQWQKIFSYDYYDPEPALAYGTGLGDLHSWCDALYFGSMHSPVEGGAQAFEELYGKEPTRGDLQNLARSVSFFRINNASTSPEIELLYGEEYLPVYDPNTNTWADEPNNLAAKPIGPSGFGNKGNIYLWTETTLDGILIAGTLDIPTNPLDNSNFGADLVAFEDCEESSAKKWDQNGLVNPLNSGWRTVANWGKCAFLGSSNGSNLQATGGAELVSLCKNEQP